MDYVLRTSNSINSSPESRPTRPARKRSKECSWLAGWHFRARRPLGREVGNETIPAPVLDDLCQLLGCRCGDHPAYGKCLRRHHSHCKEQPCDNLTAFGKPRSHYE